MSNKYQVAHMLFQLFPTVKFMPSTDDFGLKTPNLHLKNKNSGTVVLLLPPKKLHKM